VQHHAFSPDHSISASLYLLHVHVVHIFHEVVADFIAVKTDREKRRPEGLILFGKIVAVDLLAPKFRRN
jgi:hypothetical protein